MKWLAVTLVLPLATCFGTAVTDAGCTTYGAQRPSMPRPLGDGPLDQWVAGTDTAMSRACGV